MGDQDRNNSEEGMPVRVVPGDSTADIPKPPVVDHSNSPEPTPGNLGAEIGLADEDVQGDDGAPSPQRPETSSDGIERLGSRQDDAAPDSADATPSKRGPIRSWFKRQIDALRADALRRDALIGIIVLLVGFGAAAIWDARIADRQDRLARELAANQDLLARELAVNGEVQENTRFVRQVVIDGSVEKQFHGLNLRGAALAGLDLSCEDLVGDPLATGCADFSRADLSGADLSGADLSGANLVGANLTGASFAEANLQYARMWLANLYRTDLSWANLFDANMTGVDLRHANLSNAHLFCTRLEGSILDYANLSDADLSCDLNIADLNPADLTNACYNDATSWPEGFIPLGEPVCER